MSTRRWVIIGAMIAIFTLISAIGSVNAGVSFSYNLTGNCDIKANDNYNGKAISEAKSSLKEVQYSFNALGINSDNSSLYHSLSTTKAKGLETNSIFNFNYAASDGNSTEGGVMDMTENIGLTSIYSGYGSGLLPLIPASCEEVNAYSKLTGTNVLAATITKVEITEKDPVGVQYKIYAGGQKEGYWANGKVSAGVSMYVVNGSKWSYEEESTASGSFEFYKVVGYTSKITTP